MILELKVPSSTDQQNHQLLIILIYQVDWREKFRINWLQNSSLHTWFKLNKSMWKIMLLWYTIIVKYLCLKMRMQDLFGTCIRKICKFLDNMMWGRGGDGNLVKWHRYGILFGITLKGKLEFYSYKLTPEWWHENDSRHLQS